MEIQICVAIKPEAVLREVTLAPVAERTAQGALDEADDAAAHKAVHPTEQRSSWSIK